MTGSLTIVSFLFFLGQVHSIKSPTSIEGQWLKRDRAVEEKFIIKIVGTGTTHGLPTYSGIYVDGPLAGKNTFNLTMVGDLLSGTGTYNNFADDSGNMACPAPFALILEVENNVALVTYGATFGTPCGDYVGDSAVFFRT